MLGPVVCVARLPWETHGPGEARGRPSGWGAEEKRKWFIWQGCPGAKTEVKTAGVIYPKSKVEAFREKLGKEEPSGSIGTQNVRAQRDLRGEAQAQRLSNLP